MPLIRLWQLVAPQRGAWPDSTHLMRLISATPSTPKPTLGSDSPGRRLVFALQLTTPTLPIPHPTCRRAVPTCLPRLNRLGLLARWKRAEISFCFLVFQVFFTPRSRSVAFVCYSPDTPLNLRKFSSL